MAKDQIAVVSQMAAEKRNQMAAGMQSNEQTLLLILLTKKRIFPLNPAALTVAQWPRRKLAKEYQNALILRRDGILHKMEHIEVLRPSGDSIGGKLLSWILNTWQIAVQLSEPLQWPLEELKKVLADCINSQGYVFDDETDEVSYTQQIAAGILAASSVAEIFDILKVPSLEDSLDVL